MASVDRIKYREMAEQSIAKTFKGILRVAHVQEATDKDEDFYFNPIYYGTPTKGIANESTGYDSAYNGLSGSLLRYTFTGDNYKNAKLPVTDSLGNYLNLNVGADGITFGSDELNNGNNADTVTFKQLLYDKSFQQERIFPVLEAKNAIIGLKPRVNAEEKTSVTKDASLTLDASPYYDEIDAKLIVKNNYDHTPSNITDGKNYKKLSDTDKTYKYRTVYQVTNNNLKDYDALVHYQDNIDEHNLNTNHVFDSIVDVVNLKDYVKEKLEQFLSGNIVEMPTGTVIHQYISLKKWYAIGSSFTGNNPPMGKIQDTDNYTPTLYQGLVRKGINRILALSDSEYGDTSETKQLKEIIPLYKRDYALADGAIYTIYMLLPEMADNYNYPSYEQFINLFFCLGYHYTDLSNIRDHYVNTKTTLNGEEVYRWKDNTRTVSDKCTNKDVLFSIDLLAMLAIKAIYEELKYGVSNNGKSACIEPGTNSFSRQRTLTWLKSQKIPREFIFNSMVPSSQGGMQYEYKTSELTVTKSQTYNFDIGLEVNSFNSDIWYYDHELTKTVTIPGYRRPDGHQVPDRTVTVVGDYIKCKVWQTAEIQAVLDLFEKVNIARERELRDYYTFTFQVPNLVQDVPEKYSTGAFIGYSAFVWADENKDLTNLESVSTCSTTSHPHRHAVCMGPVNFKLTPDVTNNTGNITSSTMTRSEGAENWIEYMPYRDMAFNVNSYTFADVNGLSYQEEIHDGLAVKVIQMEGQTSLDHPDPRWKNAEPNRGITSPPIDMGIIDEKFRSASANTADGEVKWFQPEYIQMVPLIKL